MQVPRRAAGKRRRDGADSGADGVDRVRVSHRPLGAIPDSAPRRGLFRYLTAVGALHSASSEPLWPGCAGPTRWYPRPSRQDAEFAPDGFAVRAACSTA